MAHSEHETTIATAELLAVGAELLAGETQDTNSGDIAGSLTRLGVEVTRISQLPDSIAVISDAVRTALGRVDLVVTTGGLGPTPDDVTRESIADALAEGLAVDPHLEAWLRDLWAQRNLSFSEVNLKQAWLIPSASPMANPNGSAPGWWIEHAGQVVIALPGPPRELLPMWRDHALPRLRQRGLGLDRATQTLRLTGIGESMLVDLVGKDLLETRNPRLATYARADFVDLKVSAVGDGSHDAAAMVAAAVASLSPRLEPYLVGYDDDDWPTALGARIGKQTLATVEIGTGGFLGLLLGEAGFLAHAEQRSSGRADVVTLASGIRATVSTDIGLAAVARESGADMHVDIGIDLAGAAARATCTVFRGGAAGRRRAANAALTELWSRLAS